MITQRQQQIIKQTLQQFKPNLIGIFGSYARHEATPASDLDLLIDLQVKINLLDLVGLEQELSEKLNLKVDLITLQSVHKRVKPYIERDLIRIM